MLLSCLTGDCPGEIEADWENVGGDVECPECLRVYILEFEETWGSEDSDYDGYWFWLTDPHA